MSKKSKKASIIASAVLGAGLAIGAATTGAVLANQPLDITYYANNGTPAVSAQFKKGDNLSLPTPTREGYNFAGWYLDTGLTQQVTSTTKLKQNSKLYAGWELANYEVASANAIDLQAETTGLKSIGKYAFANSKITSVTIPDTVTSIGEGAFKDCENLYTVTLGEKLVNIGSYTFDGCLSLTSITIPDTVTTIGAGAFKNCVNLQTVSLSNKLESINAYTFDGCSSLNNITIPNTVTSIGESAFRNSALSGNLIIGKGVVNIGASAFAGCTGITELTTGGAEANVNNSAFTRITLTTVTLNSAPSAYKNALTQTKKIENITFNYNSPRIKDTSSQTLNSFPTCLTSPKNIVLGESATSIGNGAFQGCTDLTSLSISSSVTSIECDAFYDCTNLTNIAVATTNKNYCSQDSVLYNKNQSTLILCPEGKKGSFTIPPYVERIGSSAFYGCTGLTSITIPDSVTSIESGAFSYCIGLASIYIPINVEIIGASDSTVSPFRGCASTLRIYCGGSGKPEEWSDYWNYYSYVSNLNTRTHWSIAYSEYLSILCFTFDGATVTGYNGLDTDIVIPDGTTSIAPGAFQDRTGLTSITIPEGVTSIEANAFSGCTGLTIITLPDSITSIAANAFSGCTGLTCVYIPSSVTAIEASASLKSPFYGCSDTLKIYCGASSASNGWDNYWNNYDRSKKIDPIWDKSLSSCFSELYPNFTFDGSTVTGYIGTDTDVVIPNGVTGIGSSAFSEKTAITSVTMSNSIKTIGDYAFSGCTGLTSITIPNGVERIGEYSFSDCAKVEVIIIGEGVASIGDEAFYNCVNLEMLYFNARRCAPFFEAKNVFSNCGAESDGFIAIFGEYVEYIPRCCFYTYPPEERPSPNIKAIDLSHASNLQLIGGLAFGYASAVIPDGVHVEGLEPRG